MMLRPLAMAILALVTSGCSSTHFGADTSHPIHTEAAVCPGLPQDGGQTEAIAVEITDRHALIFTLGDRSLATVVVPQDWIYRVARITSRGTVDSVRHVAVAQWETPAGVKQEVALALIGPEALLLSINGRSEEVPVGQEIRLGLAARDLHRTRGD